MRRAAIEVIEQTQVWAAGGESLLHRLLGTRQPEAWRHYPDTDVRDVETGFRWYYHCHDRPGPRGEHGHFHLFAEPATAASERPPLSHLLAIGIDPLGQPLRLFTVNRWVTDEVWIDAEQALRRLARFRIDSTADHPDISRWLSAVLRLFQPQWQRLIRERDAVIARHLASGRRTLFEDRRLEVISRCPISLATQIAALQSLPSADTKPRRPAKRRSSRPPEAAP